MLYIVSFPMMRDNLLSSFHVLWLILHGLALPSAGRWQTMNELHCRICAAVVFVVVCLILSIQNHTVNNLAIHVPS